MTPLPPPLNYRDPSQDKKPLPKIVWSLIKIGIYLFIIVAGVYGTVILANAFSSYRLMAQSHSLYQHLAVACVPPGTVVLQPALIDSGPVSFRPNFNPLIVNHHQEIKGTRTYDEPLIDSWLGSFGPSLQVSHANRDGTVFVQELNTPKGRAICWIALQLLDEGTLTLEAMPMQDLPWSDFPRFEPIGGMYWGTDRRTLFVFQRSKRLPTIYAGEIDASQASRVVIPLLVSGRRETVWFDFGHPEQGFGSSFGTVRRATEASDWLGD